MVGLVELATGEMVGCIGVVHPGQQEEPEVKYAFRRDKWGIGLATESVRGIVGFARGALGKTWLMATVHPDHVNSQNVLRKSGFHHARDRANDDGSVTQVWEIDLTVA